MPDVLFDFFNKYDLYNKDVFGYIANNSTIIDIKYDPELTFIGCFPNIKDNILVGFRVILPKIIDDKTLLIWLHEYIHAILLYKKIGYFYDSNIEENEEEVLPVCYEKLFVLDNPSFMSYYQERETYLKNSDYDKYRVAFKKRDNLVKKLRKN